MKLCIKLMLSITIGSMFIGCAANFYAGTFYGNDSSERTQLEDSLHLEKE